ncbi:MULTISPECIES: NlpC/P60 family protein [Clostridium]|uniref:C40 family peptidase n=1 Tax=Clostridium TaxID=1485 RepID=UPI0008261026|nr:MULTISPECIES: NlpC/P60 family protein [Clostridium]PJI08049.1 hydrolase [Clostridium sp. CT7]
MHKKFLTALVALSVVVTCSGNVFASPLQDQYNQSLQQYENALKGVQDIEGKISVLDNQIGQLNESMAGTDKKIAQSQSNIDATQKKINETKSDISSEQELYGQRLRAMYVNGTTTQYMDVILNSKNFSDLISKIDAVKSVADYDKQIITNFKTQQDDVEKQQKVLSDENGKLQALQNENKKKLKDLNDKKAQEDKLIADAKAEEAKHSGEMQKIQQAMDAEKKKIEALNVPTNVTAKPSTSSSQGSSGGTNGGTIYTGVTGEAIVSYAKNFLGDKYVWGAKGPNEFDCSGLVWYVYKHFGITLGEDTYSQVNDGEAVTGSLQPGDLVFFYPSAKGPDHVGIYVGDNAFIQAPHTGDVVKISPLYPGSYCAARRILH